MINETTLELMLEYQIAAVVFLFMLVMFVCFTCYVIGNYIRWFIAWMRGRA